jgi:hypothetical protein
MRKVFLSILAFVLITSNVLAISLDLKNESYQQEQTIITPINGVILELITREQFSVKRINVVVPVDFDIKKINGKYYLWFIAPKTEGNYTLIIENLKTYVGGYPKIIDYSEEFKVGPNHARYNIRPGFVIEPEEFYVDLFLFSNENEIVEIDYPNKGERIIYPGNNRLNFLKEEVDWKSEKIMIGDYFLPITYENQSSKDSTISGKGLRIYPEGINAILLEDYPKEYTVNLRYYGNVSKNLDFEYNGEIFEISTKPPVELEPEEEFSIILKTNGLKEGTYEETVNFKIDNEEITFRINIQVEKEEESNITNNITLGEYKCSEIENGRFCREGETCEGALERAIDGECCIGVCIEKKPASKAWMGILLGLLAILILIYLYTNYKKVKPSKNPIEDFSKKNLP